MHACLCHATITYLYTVSTVLCYYMFMYYYNNGNSVHAHDNVITMNIIIDKYSLESGSYTYCGGHYHSW